MTDPLPLFAVTPNQAGVKVAFRRQAANSYELHRNRDAGDRFAQFDICEIAGRDIHHFRQFLAPDPLGLPPCPYIRPKSLEAGAIFDICHFSSPKDIV